MIPLLILMFIGPCHAAVNDRPLVNIFDCNSEESSKNAEYFDISQLKCESCSQSKEFQTVSEDGLSCLCQPQYYLKENFGGGTIMCEKCPDGSSTAANKWECIPCAVDPVTRLCSTCPAGELPVERALNGTKFPAFSCTKCTNNTTLNAQGTRCERCNQFLSMGNSQCSCPPNNLVGGVCFEKEGDIVAEEPGQYTVEFEKGLSVRSAFFFHNIRASHGLCQVKYGNLTACQVLTNMCTWLLSPEQSASSTNNACGLYKQLANNFEWPPGMPWLYYADSGEEVLTDTELPTEYRFPDSRLRFWASRFAYNGTFLGLDQIPGSFLQLCPDTESRLDASFQFGTLYNIKCNLKAKDLWDYQKYQSETFDLYLEFEENGKTRLFPVPVLVANLRNTRGSTNGEETNRLNWVMTRRLFLVDNISGRRDDSSSLNDGATANEAKLITGSALAIRYAAEMELRVQLQSSRSSGQIYPPYIYVNYRSVKLEDITETATVPITFGVEYTMDLEKFRENAGIAIAVLCSLAVLYSFLQSWTWSKRSGFMALNFVSIMKFFLFAMGNIANVFFVVILGSSIWWLLFYKNQSNVYLLLPTGDDENFLFVLLVVALLLKFIQLIHIIICQCTIDIFFVDWERPKLSGSKNVNTVSIWRTYFVANEWNEIQTTRKISRLIQIFAVFFVLSVIGIENLATSDPKSDTVLKEDVYYSKPNGLLRFALAGLVYISVALVQWVLSTFVYRRFIEDPIRDYVDFCSLSNISVFILENNQYGYYIHGRSVHGTADIGIKKMHENFKKEEEDLCGHRGLLTNSDQQTFQMSIPSRLRSAYDKIMMPLKTNQAAGGARGLQLAGSHIDSKMERSINAYETINRLIQAFIDRTLRNTDYIIKKKVLFESILNCEMSDNETAVLYNDDGHSFDAVLLYGHETTLIIFEILLLGFVDMIAQNIILSGIILYLVTEFIEMLRNSLGRSNLAKKTLIDKRLLI